MRPIILIIGPTAGGKTSLGVELANTLDGAGECICADSMQIYKRMDIGTAKPTTQEREAVPHHLFDLIEPSEQGFTVDSWLTRANRTIDEIRERGKWPIVVGGTNLYIQSLLFGMFDAPSANPKRRVELDERTNDQLRKLLQRLDPQAATRIHLNDRRRTIRAIEVCEMTGKTISEQQSQWNGQVPREDVRIIGLDWPVKLINSRINKRVKSMMDAGLLDEVKALQNDLGPQASEALGYKQLLSHLQGECDLEHSIERIKILTRRYAKAQRTWLRRFKPLPRTHFIEMGEKQPQLIATEALTHALSVTTSENDT
ncbi:MAG: tRNA (adenosine(37)-N6)-dimethylallyltransferase MiaA [Phycisphaerales bacterium]|nr:tRNA (adenosine(37)-N6)-dimethylallyltransferase MiaA [Phycisphaerales bacterium]